jgi:hypothetical protein
VALVLVLGCALYTAKVTAAAWQSFQQTRTLSIAKDARTIQPWMSIAFIAHTYQVPERYLVQALNLPAKSDPRLTHISLVSLATRTKRPINTLIHVVQSAVNTYHKQHPLPVLLLTPAREQHQLLKSQSPWGALQRVRE